MTAKFRFWGEICEAMRETGSGLKRKYVFVGEFIEEKRRVQEFGGWGGIKQKEKEELKRPRSFLLRGGGGETKMEFWSLEVLSCGERSVMGPIGFLSFE